VCDRTNLPAFVDLFEVVAREATKLASDTESGDGSISSLKTRLMVPDPAPTSRRDRFGFLEALSMSMGRRWAALFSALRHSWCWVAFGL